MKNTLIGWAIFWSGFGVEILTDFLLRIRAGDMHKGGIPEPLWYYIQIFLLVCALYFLYEGTKKYKSIFLRIFLVLIQVGLGFALIIFASIYYVCSAGID